MQSYESLKRSIAGKTVEHARRLGLSTGLLNKWQEPSADPSDSGAYNPLDRIETIIQTALDLGIDRDAALSPIYYLNVRFGVNAPPDEAETIDDLSLELVATIREMGHLTTVASEALAEREITRRHVAKIEEEGNHLIRRVSAFMKKAKDATRRKFSLFTRKKRREDVA